MYGDRDFEGVGQIQDRRFKVWFYLALIAAVTFFMGMMYSVVDPTIHEPPSEPVAAKPDLSEINARNIEVLRGLLEQETGKQITFMAEMLEE